MFGRQRGAVQRASAVDAKTTTILGASIVLGGGTLLCAGLMTVLVIALSATSPVMDDEGVAKAAAAERRQFEGTWKVVGLEQQGVAVTEEELKTLFSECGTVLSIQMATPEEGHPLGFARVQMGPHEAAEQAIRTLHHVKLDGSTLLVYRSSPDSANGWSQPDAT